LIGRKLVNLIVGWCGRFLFFVVARQFSQDIGEWPENQILILDWTDFHCPGATPVEYKRKIHRNVIFDSKTYFHCSGATLTIDLKIFFFCCPLANLVLANDLKISEGGDNLLKTGILQVLQGLAFRC